MLKRLLIVCMILALLLTGCTEHRDETEEGGETKSAGTTQATETTEEADTSISFAPAETGIFICCDGTIKSAEITSFDNSAFETPRYTEAGLRKSVEGWIQDYNKEAGREAVKLESLAVDDKTATLILAYADCEAFMGFQGEDFGVAAIDTMSAGEAKAAGIGISNMRIYGGGMAVSSELYADAAIRLLEISGKVTVYFEDQVLYYSEGLKPVDRYCVEVNSSKTVYILFK